MTAASAHWGALAIEADEHAAYLESRGEHAGAWRAKAKTYRDTIRAIELEETTGQPHCVCCLKPSGPKRAPVPSNGLGTEGKDR